MQYNHLTFSGTPFFDIFHWVTRPSLLGHHISDGTVAMGCLPIAAEDYKLSLHRRIVVVGENKKPDGTSKGRMVFYTQITRSPVYNGR
jgi:hypothetical protein